MFYELLRLFDRSAMHPEMSSSITSPKCSLLDGTKKGPSDLRSRPRGRSAELVTSAEGRKVGEPRPGNRSPSRGAPRRPRVPFLAARAFSLRTPWWSRCAGFSPGNRVPIFAEKSRTLISCRITRVFAWFVRTRIRFWTQRDIFKGWCFYYLWEFCNFYWNFNYLA